MNNSLTRRHFLLSAGLVLASFLILAASFISLSYRYIIQDKKEELLESVKAAAVLSEMVMEKGVDAEEDAFPVFAPIISNISDSDVLMCSAEGIVQHCITNEDGIAAEEPAYSGVSVDSAVISGILADGSWSGMSNLGIYSAVRFIAGVPVYSDSSETQLVGFIFLTASASRLVVLWRSLVTIFFFTAVAVLMIAFISSSIFALQQVKPLREMSDVVHRFGQGEYDLRADDYGRSDEIGDLARNFNSMADSIASAEQRRQEFMANISHELKTPMTTISGFVNGILDGTVPEEKVTESLQVVSSETARLSRLVRQMLDASALQAKGAVQSHVEFDINETMIQCIISLEGKIRNRHLDMDVHIPDTSVKVWGDPDSITQVCYNLLDNAAKFALPGTAIGVTISTRGAKAYVSVKNKGETIPPEELSMIFDRFHKSDRSRSMDKEGVGLGLYIVKTILNNHKEDITVTSANGITEFIFTLTRAE